MLTGLSFENAFVKVSMEADSGKLRIIKDGSVVPFTLVCFIIIIIIIIIIYYII